MRGLQEVWEATILFCFCVLLYLWAAHGRARPGTPVCPVSTPLLSGNVWLLAARCMLCPQGGCWSALMCL